MQDSPDPAKLKAQVIEARGYWHPFHEGLLELAPDYLAAYLAFQDAPARSGRLEPKIREFIYIAADGAVSHLYSSGLQRHIGMALEKGATPREVLEVIELTMLTAHAPHEMGLRILAEEMAAAGSQQDEMTRPLSADEERRKKRHIEATGRWPACGDILFRLAPDFVDAFLAYEAIPYAKGTLAPKVKDMILIAVSAAPTMLDATATRRHIRAALGNGATGEEIAEILQLTSAISIHTCTAAVPALMDAIRAGA
ncbi:carboxymuconolactone decarboxylase family protein [Chelativorans sp. AA-79]|uniref:carboxymuconolactone decarboxylase family protein n=1 Tax=Chelativorans sp. AA-79 TaxID=3028735 RepID=UPI0023F942D1|nr:carboxymuconolactone decarboxylase family protein [Chelativorans sp. AA-79]WEX09036.1 carboxymuconolactone decarboxylase family protein [Chelativorans sp. AA-79]